MTLGTTNFPTAVDDDASLGVAKNNAATNLDGALADDTNGNNSSATEITVLSTALFPTAGWITVGVEIISYTGKTATKFTGIVRAVDSSTRSAHANSAVVSQFFTAIMREILAAALKAIQTYLLTGDHEFASNKGPVVLDSTGAKYRIGVDPDGAITATPA